MAQNILQPVYEAILAEELAFRRRVLSGVQLPKPESEIKPTPPSPEPSPPQQEPTVPAATAPEPAATCEPPTPTQAPNHPGPASRRQRTRRTRPRPSYHRIRCTICNHPDRDAIEEAFLQWRRPGDLAREFKISHRTAIYRHAHALGLFQRRAREMHFALGRIIEQAEWVKPTANSIIRAIKACTNLDDNGRWHDPPRRIIVTYQSAEPGDFGTAANCRSDEDRHPEWRIASEEPLMRVAKEASRKSIATTAEQKSQ